MEWLERKELTASFLKKYRWAALVLLLGIVLMALPAGEEESRRELVEPTESVETRDLTLQQELKILLSQMAGAGKVEVLLTEAKGPESLYQQDQQTAQSPDSQDRQFQTVIITRQDRSEQPVVKRTDPPVYLGAVVLCQGADSPAVRLAVVDAVSTATGLTSDKISVLKMK